MIQKFSSDRLLRFFSTLTRPYRPFGGERMMHVALWSVTDPHDGADLRTRPYFLFFFLLSLIALGRSNDAQAAPVTSLRLGSNAITYAIVEPRTGQIQLVATRGLRISAQALPFRAKTRGCRVGRTLAVPTTTGLSFDGRNPVVVYARARDGALVNATRSGRKWVERVIDNGSRVCGVISATRCRSGTCVSYFDERRATLKLATGGSSKSKGWSIRAIGRVGENAGAMNSIAVHGHTTTIAYADSVGKVIRIADVSGRTIRRSWIAYPQDRPGLYPSVSIDRGGATHVIAGFLSLPSRGIVYAKRIPRESWRVGLISDQSIGESPALLIDGRGRTFVGIVPEAIPGNLHRSPVVEATMATLHPSGVWSSSIHATAAGASPHLHIINRQQAALSTLSLTSVSSRARRPRRTLSVEQSSFLIDDPTVQPRRINQLRTVVP